MGEPLLTTDPVGLAAVVALATAFVATGVLKLLLPPNGPTLDHAGIVRTVHDALRVDERLTTRDQHAASVLPLLTLTEARTPPALPSPPRRLLRAVAQEGAPERVDLDDFQRSLVELTRLLDEHRAPRLRRATPPWRRR